MHIYIYNSIGCFILVVFRNNSSSVTVIFSIYIYISIYVYIWRKIRTYYSLVNLILFSFRIPSLVFSLSNCVLPSLYGSNTGKVYTRNIKT